MSKPLKVIQWATGNIGLRSLTAAIEHPELELVGLWVSSDSKVGKDAAELCGLNQLTGVQATNNGREIEMLEADCVLYMPQGTDIDQLCRLLSSGKNIVTTRGDFHDPLELDSNTRELVEDACRAGGSSIYSTGSSPGFITEAVALPLLSLSRKLDCLTIDEYGDVGPRDSPQMIFEIMGFGEPMGAFNQARAEYAKADFAASLGQVARACGITIDRWEAYGEFSPASETVEIAAGRIEKGTVGAQRITITGFSGDIARFRFRANWFATNRVENKDWNLQSSGWRVQVEGDTPLDVSIGFPVPKEQFASFSPGLTAHRAVNAVQAVCAASPGIRTTVDLPQVVARFCRAEQMINRLFARGPGAVFSWRIAGQQALR